MNDIICPFAKIRPIWVWFETEANLGSDWIRKRAIRAHLRAGLGYLRSRGWGFWSIYPFFRVNPRYDTMPYAQNASSGFALRTYRDSNAKTDSIEIMSNEMRY
jgi:hypothetical protein